MTFSLMRESFHACIKKIARRIQKSITGGIPYFMCALNEREKKNNERKFVL